MKKAYILMSRVPIPRRTKTRLEDVLEARQCAELHRCFLKDLFAMTRNLKDEIDVFLTYTPEGKYSLMEDLVPDYIQAFPQEGEDLGLRMGNAINHLLSLGYQAVILTGTDIPTIQSRDILDLFQILEDKDIVLSPTMDGGYYAIGMKTYHPYLFEGGYGWGKRSVFDQTLEAIEGQGHSVGLGRLNMDIDTKEDLSNFLDKIGQKELEERPENTITYMEEVCRKKLE